MGYVFYKLENSCTQEPHHVAQKLTSVNLRVALVRSFLKSSAVAGSSCTGCASSFCSASIREDCFSCHFVEQPNTPVCFIGTSLCAKRASMALRASCVFTSSVR